MSLEQALAAATEAVNRLTAVLQAQTASVPQPSASQQPQPSTPAVAATQMPAPPAFAAAPIQPPAPPAGPTAPFNDANGLMQYTMAAYQSLGAAKGAQIQNVLQALGHANLNDVRPDQYGQFFAGVESIKAAP